MILYPLRLPIILLLYNIFNFFFINKLNLKYFLHIYLPFQFQWDFQI